LNNSANVKPKNSEIFYTRYQKPKCTGFDEKRGKTPRGTVPLNNGMDSIEENHNCDPATSPRNFAVHARKIVTNCNCSRIVEGEGEGDFRPGKRGFAP
jgi:hypothetical protein